MSWVGPPPLPPPAPAVRLEPVRGGDRLVALDVLRGLALLGILAVNVQGFRGADSDLLDAARFPGAFDQAARWLVIALAEGKFYPLFSFLFGYGFVLQLHRAQVRGRRGEPSYVRRLVALGAIGLVHGCLLWWGDILLTYAVAGAVLLAFRRVGTRALLGWAAVLIGAAAAATAIVTTLAAGATTADGMPAALADAARELHRHQHGTFWSLAGDRTLTYAGLLAAVVFGGYLLMVVGCMVLGAWAARVGLLARPGLHRALLERVRRWAVLGLAGGALLATVRLATDSLGGWGPAAALGVATLVGAVTAPFLTGGYVAGVALVRSAPVGRALGLLAPAGRMALTNYLAQSVACSFVFEPYGLGWYGRVGPAAALAFAVAVWALQVVVSGLWLRGFRFGPAEWVLRSVTYARVQPFLRRPATLAVG